MARSLMMTVTSSAFSEALGGLELSEGREEGGDLFDYQPCRLSSSIASQWNRRTRLMLFYNYQAALDI